MAGSLESRGNLVMLINYQQRRAKAGINRPQAISRCLFLYPFPLHTYARAQRRMYSSEVACPATAECVGGHRQLIEFQPLGIQADEACVLVLATFSVPKYSFY